MAQLFKIYLYLIFAFVFLYVLKQVIIKSRGHGFSHIIAHSYLAQQLEYLASNQLLVFLSDSVDNSSIVQWSVSPPVTRETGVQFPVGEEGRILFQSNRLNLLFSSKAPSFVQVTLAEENNSPLLCPIQLLTWVSRVAQRKRAGPITQRSVDRNYALLFLKIKCFLNSILKNLAF